MHRTGFFFLACVLANTARLWGAEENGGELFQKHCAACHRDPPVNRAPLPEALRKLSQEAILSSLESGSMKEQGRLLTLGQRQAIASFLTRGADRAAGATSSVCPAGYEPRTSSSYFNGWGADVTNSNFQPASRAGLRADQIPKLQLKWAFGFPGASAAMGQPTLVGGRLYFGSQDGTVYSIDAHTGCVFWTFKASATVRAAVTIGTVGHARQAALFGDTQAQVYAVNARDGSLIWKVKVDDHPLARITGAPKMHGSRLYVPVSSIEEVSGGSPKYECCRFRGSVVALDIEGGKILWKTYTIPDEPHPTKKNKEGVQLYGPSGAAVWLSPTLDLKRRWVYVGTGNAYSDPPTQFSDAILALEMDTGKLVWSKQLTERDGWNFACVNPNKTNCPENAGPDVDIGASPILREIGGGKRVLVVGQKSGMVHGLDPDAEGRILWQTRVGEGGSLGGVQWGMAADQERVYVALSDVHKRLEAGGLFALSLEKGEKVWYAPPVKPPCAGKFGCTPALMAPVAVMDTVVFAGAMDGVLRAYESKSGQLIWEYNTLQSYSTVNGVKAQGGSLSATGPVLAEGMMFLNSGYGLLGGMAGNVLLAFKPAP
ncbi:MAG: PQQ-binding-like beta-propeller repeat protein [Bryobacteraceae bacterium]|nr:PQQ-binding-like beta-propeller repeat protein [Bryobacteraceae bacterium]MDW8378716.1 PQQ-binding-like beta-propeller repeat protein [Bryobacterales bacterium]